MRNLLITDNVRGELVMTPKVGVTVCITVDAVGDGAVVYLTPAQLRELVEWGQERLAELEGE